jgi:hypothetical protein
MLPNHVQDCNLSEMYVGFCPIIEWPYVVDDAWTQPGSALILSVCPYCTETTGVIAAHAQPALEARQ